MERWNISKSAEVENRKIDAFLEEVVSVCKKHGLAISHEDGHGAFEVVNLEEGELGWLMNAHDDTGDTTIDFWTV